MKTIAAVFSGLALLMLAAGCFSFEVFLVLVVVSYTGHPAFFLLSALYLLAHAYVLASLSESLDPFMQKGGTHGND